MPGARVSKAPSDSPGSRLVLAVRRQRRWTQADMAYELGYSEAAVASWEAGRREPSPAVCLLLAQWLRESGQRAA